ncbi:2-C-methyl-D-erythritol 4-phosphate cytidylyltransferase [Pedobacter cryotolerans]|uniref:2-C-methyl-D-erythritol 4-phosphate cytidylyltransferase n=1 Tax=Pedobacter cryotolerans TaxID=2571270 RepID=A0A4U1C043_9SPHI|nr:2-C-methyl-D-erythritol 4-phosphate cytidylyltransferase [Pedobacter cryotolerans]TKB98355.1 2-C-methyl-D-erythritol 4-phosphate cytidylyltransferase [Pedobacter cryotolerans]
MKYYAIIVAGGSGTRMQTTIAKQFLLLKNKPVLMHTLLAFANSSYKPQLILVLNANLVSYWDELCLKHNFDLPHLVIAGGDQRFHSVRNGLMAIKDDGIIAIHDAVRPLVSHKLIDNAYQTAQELGNAIAAIKPSDSVRKLLSKTNSEIVNRDELVLVQTPQTFHINQLRTAYQQHYEPTFTDDASVVERAGFKINLIEGERNNFKITYQEDLELANFLIK